MCQGCRYLQLGFLAKGNNFPKHCNCNWARTLSNPSATQIIVNEGLRCHVSIKPGYYKVCRSSSRPGFRITMKQRREMVLGTVWGTFCWSYCENCFQLSTALICEDAAASARTPGGLSILCQCDEDTAAKGNLAGPVRTALEGCLLPHGPCALRHFVVTMKHAAPSASLSWQEGTSPPFHVCFSRFHAIGLCPHI